MTTPRVKIGNRPVYFRSRTNDYKTDFTVPLKIYPDDPDMRLPFIIGGDQHPDFNLFGVYDEDLTLALHCFKDGVWPASGPPQPRLEWISYVNPQGYYTTMRGNDKIRNEFADFNPWTLLGRADGGAGKPKVAIWGRRAISQEYNISQGYSYPVTGSLPKNLNDRQFNVQAGSYNLPIAVTGNTASGQGLQINFPLHPSIDSRAWASRPNTSPILTTSPTLYNGSNLSIGLSSKNSDNFADKSYHPRADSLVGNVNCGDGWFVAQPGACCWSSAHVVPSDGSIIPGFGVNFVGDQFTQGLTFPWTTLMLHIAAAPDLYVEQGSRDPYLMKKSFTDQSELNDFDITGQYGLPPGAVTIL